MKRTGFFARALALVAAPLMPAVIAELLPAEPEAVDLEPMAMGAMGGLPSSVEDEFLTVRLAGMDGPLFRNVYYGTVLRSSAQSALPFGTSNIVPDLDDILTSDGWAGPYTSVSEVAPWADRFELLSNRGNAIVAQGRIWAEQVPTGWDANFYGSWLPSSVVKASPYVGRFGAPIP